MIRYFAFIFFIMSMSVASGPLQKQSEDAADFELTLAEEVSDTILKVDCIVNALRANEPISCEGSLEKNAELALNIEKQIRSNNTFTVTAFPCCEVFSKDEQFGKKCKQTCRNLAMTPLLTDEEKFVHLSTCRRQNKYLQCFSDCINHDFNANPNPPKSCDA